MTETRGYAASRAGCISKNDPPLKIIRSSCVRKGEGTKEQGERRKEKEEERGKKEGKKTEKLGKKGDEGRKDWAFFFNNSIILMLVCVQNFVNMWNPKNLTKNVTL